MMLLSLRTVWISPVALLLTLSTLSSDGAAQTPAQPRSANRTGLPQSVILGGDAYGPTLQRLHVVRQYSLASVRSNPQVALGDARLDFTPMLSNPKALFNVAERLRAMPQQIQVQEQSSDITEIDQGFVVHQVLTYRILPGKCADATAKSQLAQAGVSCFTRATQAERIVEFSRPGSPRYVADPQKRQTAIAAYQRNSALEDTDTTKYIAELRQVLADPTRRAAITAQIGAQETSRLQTLNDDQLREELINSSVQRFEETSFIPRVQSSIYAHPIHNLHTAPSMAEISAGQALARGSASGDPAGFPKLLRMVPASAYRSLGNSTSPGGDKISDLDLGTYYYLTGFTLGHDYEWSREVDVTVNWCIVGCSSTYSIKVWAGFNYGFGLRFPIQADLKYHSVVHPNNSAQATTTATFEPLKGGDEQVFEDTGLSSDQLFNAQNLVAQVGANAGYDVNLPVLGGSNNWTIGIDFTQYLPPPFQGGIFQPPAPGTGGINSPFIFSQFDLLGGLLNFGVVGGQVFPAVNLNLHSDKLQFTLTDEILNKPTLVNAPSQSVNVAVNNAAMHDSHFKFGYPVYNLGFTLTPGIAANLFVDIAVWSDNWTWPIWFPQLAITVPSGGVDFSCHTGTTCFLDFQPEHQAAVTTGIDQQLNSLGCKQQGSAMSCPTYRGYVACLKDLNSHPLGIQSCEPGMAMKQGQAADRTLTGGGCQRNGSNIGNYSCPGEGGMLGLCQTMLNNGAVLSCSLLVPASTDQILRHGGCRENPGPPGTYSCPASMMGLCQLYVKNHVIVACKP